MRKFFLAFISIGLIACSNTDEETFSPISEAATTPEFENVIASLEDTNTVYVESVEDLYKDCIEKTKEYNNSYEYYINPTVIPRLSVTDYTAKGYDSETKIRSTKMQFSQKMADLLRVFANQVYIVEYYIVEKNVQRAKNSRFIDDESCTTVGWRPIDEPIDHSWDIAELGYYSVKLNDDVQILRSQYAKVAYNILGQEIKGIQYPMRSPSNYIWNYSCLIQ